MEELFKEQKNLIKKVIKFNSSSLKKGIDPSLNPLSYMTTWTVTPGYFKLLDLQDIKNFKLFFILKDIFSISKLHNFKAKGFFDIQKDLKIKNLIISYCTKKNFDKEGNFYDSYFNISSKNKKYVWFLISLDNKYPKKIKENIIIFKKDSNKQYDLIFFLKSLFAAKKNLHLLSNSYIFNKIINSEFKKHFSNKIIKNVIINYEAIPFQHGLIQTLKKINNKTNIICYLHCAGWPLQTELIYKEKKIDKMIVSGIDQKEKLIKYLNWPKKKIEHIPSLRFEKKKKNLFNGIVFIPFEIFQRNKILENFDNFIGNLKKKSFNKLKCKIHPLNESSSKHRELAIKIDKIIKKNSDKFNNFCKKKSSIIFGSATGVCVQSIEEGITIYHFPNNDVLDVFSEKIWPNIKVKKLSDKVYEYSLKKKNKSFLVNNEKNKFDRYLLPLLK